MSACDEAKKASVTSRRHASRRNRSRTQESTAQGSEPAFSGTKVLNTPEATTEPSSRMSISRCYPEITDQYSCSDSLREIRNRGLVSCVVELRVEAYEHRGSCGSEGLHRFRGGCRQPFAISRHNERCTLIIKIVWYPSTQPSNCLIHHEPHGRAMGRDPIAAVRKYTARFIKAPQTCRRI